MPTRLANAGALGGAHAKPSAASRWIDARLNDAAAASARFSDRFRRRRRVAFSEQSDGSFVLLAPKRVGAPIRFENGRFSGAGSWRGCEVELRLAPARCVFRNLELPARAAEFLEGVVRAQIDRVTPWRAAEAAFGWATPELRGDRRIAVWVAAAKRGPILELIEATVAAGADAVSVTTARAEGETPIELLARRQGAFLRVRRWRFALVALMFVAIAAGLAALAAQWTIGAGLDGEIDALTTQIGQRRTALLRLEHAGADPAGEALATRKRATPAAVIVLEALSRALPDEAYLTEMRLEGDKVEVSGVAADAADLIHAIEKSPHFSQATFTAPTTRGVDENTESFRIEALVTPLLKVAP